MSLKSLSVLLVALVALVMPVRAADSASGAVTVQKLGAISPKHAVAFLVRQQGNARLTSTEILLSDLPVDAAAIQAAFDPHMEAINVDVLRDRNYVLLWVTADGVVSMNATFSKTMTQFVDNTNMGLKVTWTTRSASRLEGRLFSSAPIKTMDGTTYSVDLRFAVDVPKAPEGQALPAGGGDPGKALTALLAAAGRKNWTAIRAVLGPDALKMLDKDYNTPAENAANANDMLKAWIPTQKMKIAGGMLNGDVAVLDVEGEMFPGMMSLSRVQMVKAGTAWKFERAARAGSLP